MTVPCKSDGDLISNGTGILALNWDAWPATLTLYWRRQVFGVMAKTGNVGVYSNGINCSIRVCVFSNGYVGWTGHFWFSPFISEQGVYGHADVTMIRAYDVTQAPGINPRGLYRRTSAETLYIDDGTGLQPVDCSGSIRVA